MLSRGSAGFLIVACLAASPNDITRKASELTRSGKPNDAEALLRKAAEAEPDSAEIHAEFGRFLLWKKSYEDAVSELGRAVQLQPESLDYSMALAEALIGWRHFSVAVQFLQAVETRFTSQAAFHYNLGLAHYALRNTKAALPEFREALRLNANLDEAKFLVGGCLVATGELNQAADLYRELANKKPQNSAFWLALGQVLDTMGDEHRVEALSASRMALKLNPSSPGAQFQTAALLAKSGDYAGARPLLETLVQTQPDQLPAHVILARVYARLKLPELAKRESEIVSHLSSAQTTNGANATTADNQ